VPAEFSGIAGWRAGERRESTLPQASENVQDPDSLRRTFDDLSRERQVDLRCYFNSSGKVENLDQVLTPATCKHRESIVEYIWSCTTLL
jgi:hypothetical protein